MKSVRKSSHYANGRTRRVYTPTVAYTVDGNSYEVNGQGSGKSDYYTEGSKITVFYNPENPEKCITIPFNDSRRGAGITMIVGAGIALLGVIAIFAR